MKGCRCGRAGEKNIACSKEHCMANTPLLEKSLLFAVRIVRLYKYLMEEKKEFVLSKQLLRAGTCPGAMIREAVNAESNSDFIHKLGIAQKEIAETEYWLELLFRTEYLSETEYKSIAKDSEELMKITRSAILTLKRKKGRSERRSEG